MNIFKSKKVSTISKDTALKVANWWADRICGFVRFDNGDNSMGSMFASIMAEKLVKPVTEEQKQKFIDALASKIEGKEDMFLDVDYHPSKTLVESAEEAGISRNNFPWKTCTVMERAYGENGFKIYGIHGYGAERELIAEQE